MLATSPSAAQRAAQLVAVSYDPPEHPPLLSMEQAVAAGALHHLPALMPWMPAGELPSSVQVLGGARACVCVQPASLDHAYRTAAVCMHAHF